MIDQRINEQLELLQNELLKLKTATDYIDSTKENSSIIINELVNTQQNYTSAIDKIFNIYKQNIGDLKNNTEIQIKDGLLNFEKIGNSINSSNKENGLEIKKLLEQYKNIVESTDSLVKFINGIDFPQRLGVILDEVKIIKAETLENIKLIEKNNLKRHDLIIQNFNNQNKRLHKINITLYAIIALLGIIFIILFIKKII